MGVGQPGLPDDEFAEQSMNYAQELANRSPLGLRYTKESLAFAASHNLADTISKEAALQAFCVDSEDSKEAISAFFHKRQPEWRGK